MTSIKFDRYIANSKKLSEFKLAFNITENDKNETKEKVNDEESNSVEFMNKNSCQDSQNINKGLAYDEKHSDANNIINNKVDTEQQKEIKKLTITRKNEAVIDKSSKLISQYELYTPQNAAQTSSNSQEQKNENTKMTIDLFRSLFVILPGGTFVSSKDVYIQDVSDSGGITADGKVKAVKLNLILERYEKLSKQYNILKQENRLLSSQLYNLYTRLPDKIAYDK